MEENNDLSEVATFIQEERALRSIWKGTRPEEPIFSNFFTWISHELFNDIELKPSALRHAIQKHILTSRKDIIDVLLNLLTGSTKNLNRIEELRIQVIDPRHDADNYLIYLYCLATFLDIDIYVVTREGEDYKWNEYKSLKLQTIRQEIRYKDKPYKFETERGHPGFQMAYIHMRNGKDMDIHIIRPSVRSDRPKCSGLLEQAAQQLKCKQLHEIEIPDALVVDVRRNAARLPKCERTSYWVEEYCRERRIETIYQRTIEVSYTVLTHQFQAPCACDELCQKFIKHLSDASEDHVKIFCKILVRRCEFAILKLLCEKFDSLDIPYTRKYEVLQRLEMELRRFNDALVIGSCPAEMQKRREKVNRAVIGTSVSGLVGGALGIAGLILIPITFGASLGLTIAGGVIGGVSGFVQGGFRVHEAVKQNKTTRRVTEGFENIRDNFEQALKDFTNEFDTDTLFRNNTPVSPGRSIRGSLSVGSAFRMAHSAVGIVLAAAKVGATVATTVVSILGPISIILDGGFLAEAIYNKQATGDNTQAGMKLECLHAFQTVVLATYRGNTDFSINIVENTMREK